MKGLMIFIAISLFLIGFIAAISITSSAIENNTGTSRDNSTISSVNPTENKIQTCLDACPVGCAAPAYQLCASNGQKYCNTCAIECYGLTEADNSFCENLVPVTATNTESENEKIIGAVNSVRSEEDEITHTNLTVAQIKNIITDRNKLRFENRTTIPCPTSCICTGSTMKCLLLGGNREMIISAGKSGNIIVQVEGANMTTNVTLYKASDLKIYGVFKNNETRIIRMLPDQVSEKIRENLSEQLENENITLDNNGTYQYTGEKKARLFFIFPVKVDVDAKVDSETGNIISIKNKWWAFLARDENNGLVGASCGTVTPGQNDNCCKSRGYDVWNMGTGQCEFSS